MTYSGPPDDRQAVRERLEAYADAVFRRDADDWIANWAEAAEWSLLGVTLSGRSAIKSAWTKAMAEFPFAAFFVQPAAIEITGDAATARSFAQEILTLSDGGLRQVIGRYDDALVKQDGRWLFTRRSYTILHDKTEAG